MNQMSKAKKLVVLFNTLVKLKTYDFPALLKEADFDFISVVENKEIEGVKRDFSSIFKQVLPYETAKFELANIIKNYKLEDVRFVCISEDYLLPASEFRSYFNVEGINEKTANLFRNKMLMKAALANTSVSVPKFAELSEFSTFEKAKERLGLPFVIKPKDAFGSKDVSIIKTEEDFEIAFSEISNKEEFECESFISGKLYHVDSIYKNGVPIFQVCNEYSCPNAEFRDGKALVSIPLPQSHEIAKKASVLSQNVIEAFDYNTGATHLEFFVKEDGEFVFLEIAGRTPGAVIVPMYNKQFEINLPNIDLLNHFDLLKHQDFKSKMHCFSGIFPIFKGIVSALNAPKINGTFDLKFLVKEGNILDDCKSLRDISATILAENESFEKAYQDFQTITTFKAIEVS